MYENMQHQMLVAHPTDITTHFVLLWLVYYRIKYTTCHNGGTPFCATIVF